MYKIRVNYDTGNSYNTYPGEEEILDYNWLDIDVVQANIRRIAEHYKWCSDKNSWNKRLARHEGIEPTWNKNSGESSIILLLDNYKEFKISTSWIGYFETLNYVEIFNDNSDWRIDIN